MVVFSAACSAQNAHEATLAQAAIHGIAILPNRTDPEIQTFDHHYFAYVDRDGSLLPPVIRFYS